MLSTEARRLPRHAEGGPLTTSSHFLLLASDVYHADAAMSRLLHAIYQAIFAMVSAEPRFFTGMPRVGRASHSSHVLSLTFNMATSRWPAPKRARLPDTPKEVACRTARMSTAWQKQRGLKALPDPIAWAQTDCHCAVSSSRWLRPYASGFVFVLHTLGIESTSSRMRCFSMSVRCTCFRAKKASRFSWSFSTELSSSTCSNVFVLIVSTV